jgi:NADH-quinone oxidoreductase subunit J
MLFYLFSSISLVGSFFVVFSANPVHSVLSLILVFCSTSLVLFTLSVDFLSILFVVVYVGAIAVLFLFVVMMLNVKIAQLNESVLRWLPLAVFIGLSFATQFLYLVSFSFGAYTVYPNFSTSWLTDVFGFNALSLIGSAIYSFFSYNFLVSGFVLLTALFGAITLTVGTRRMSRRQLVYKQVGRDSFTAVSFYA